MIIAVRVIFVILLILFQAILPQNLGQDFNRCDSNTVDSRIMGITGCRTYSEIYSHTTFSLSHPLIRELTLFIRELTLIFTNQKIFAKIRGD